ncbi:MAG: HlyD family efflux transporter periplasmic adaptor subunit [Betaproteobacteria bacterium]|nr:HlyD family efflux transporter periplasmic adaptor subunit [Betaproteobacteria bacterium]
MKLDKPFYKTSRFLVACAAALLIAGGISFSRYNRAIKFEAQQAKRTVKVERRDVRRDLLLTGKVLPASAIAVYSPVSGQLRQVLVQEGQTVRESQVLFAVLQDSSGQKELESRQAEVQRTRLEMQAAEENLDRRKNVRDLFSQSENEKAENDYYRAKLSYETARQQLSLLEEALGLKTGKTIDKRKSQDGRLSMIFVKAPRQGVITFLNKAVGESVMATAESAEATGREVLIISDTEKMMVRSRILEADLGVVKTGQAVRIKLDAFPQKHYDGVVNRISQQGVEDKTGGFTYFVTDILIQNPDRDVRAQMNASIELVVAENKNVLSLPANAVATLNGHSVVERPRSSASESPRFEKVKAGLVTDLWVELAGDELKEGDAVLEIDFAKLDLKLLAEGKLGEKAAPQNQRADNPR